MPVITVLKNPSTFLSSKKDSVTHTDQNSKRQCAKTFKRGNFSKGQKLLKGQKSERIPDKIFKND